MRPRGTHPTPPLVCRPNATANFTAVLSNASLPLTLFAPNNAAFNALVAQLGPSSAADLISNRTAVTELLLTHVVAGTWDSTLLVNGTELESLQGARLGISKTSNGFTDVVAPGSTGRVLVADIAGGEQVGAGNAGARLEAAGGLSLHGCGGPGPGRCAVLRADPAHCGRGAPAGGWARVGAPAAGLEHSVSGLEHHARAVHAQGAH